MISSHIFPLKCEWNILKFKQSKPLLDETLQFTVEQVYILHCTVFRWKQLQGAGSVSPLCRGVSTVAKAHPHTSWFALCSWAAPRWGARGRFEDSSSLCNLNLRQPFGAWPWTILWWSNPGLPLCGYMCLGSLVPGHVQEPDHRLLSRLRAKFSGS